MSVDEERRGHPLVRDRGADTSKGIEGGIHEEEAKLLCPGSQVNRKECFWEEGDKLVKHA